MSEFCGLLSLCPIILQIPVQACAPNTQNLRGPQAISLAQIENPMDVYLAHLLQGQRTPLVALCRARPPMLQTFRQIRQVNEVSTGREAWAGDHVLQLPHVSRPGML